MSSGEEEVRPKRALRGKAAAALLLNSDSEEHEESSSDIFKTTKPKGESESSKKINAKSKTCGGIYSQAISETKQNIKAAHTKCDKIDKYIIEHTSEVDKENILIKKSNQIKKKKQATTADYVTSDSNSSSDNNNDSDVENETNSSKSDSSLSSSSNLNISNNRSPSPPPPPTHLALKKRKSTTIVDKQLKELDKIKHLQTTSFNSTSNAQDSDENEDLLNLVTIRVSTKTGVQKFDINKIDPFLKIYEQIAKLEKTDIENIVLVLRDKRIGHNETPESINLQVFEIFEFNKIAGKKIERIQIIEKANEEPRNDPPNKIVITFQTCEGRKSRITFNVFKDEPFKNILKLYCEKKELGNWQEYMIEFDGEKVSLEENANDLDLDGDEIFDVKKNSKAGASLDVINSNKNNYQFDDDILVA